LILRAVYNALPCFNTATYRKGKETMLKNRKIELQAKTIRRLRDDNLRLAAENKELKRKLQEQTKLIEAAGKYRAEHQKSMAVLERAKEKYNEAARTVMAEKKK